MSRLNDNPAPGDYVGQHNETGERLYVAAVDHEHRLVQIAGHGKTGPWLNETQARAFYSYEWGKKTRMPFYG